MLKEITLYGTVDKVEVAMARLRLHEPPDGYHVAFSGGKDSCVILDLCRRAGVKHDAHYNVTTVDPPEAETVYIAETRKYIPDVWACGVIEELKQDVYDMGYDGEYLNDVTCEDEEALCDMFTATFVKWAKKRSMEYWVDVVRSGTERMYNLKTGRRVK